MTLSQRSSEANKKASFLPFIVIFIIALIGFTYQMVNMFTTAPSITISTDIPGDIVVKKPSGDGMVIVFEGITIVDPNVERVNFKLKPPKPPETDKGFYSGTLSAAVAIKRATSHRSKESGIVFPIEGFFIIMKTPANNITLASSTDVVMRYPPMVLAVIPVDRIVVWEKLYPIIKKYMVL